MSCKKVILRNFAKFTGKHLRQRLFFNKAGEIWYSTFFHRTPLVACHRPATLLKNSFWHRCFSVSFTKFDSTWYFRRIPPVAASELVKKCYFKLFRLLRNEYIIYIKKYKKYIANALNVSRVSSAVIFSTTIEYRMLHLHPVSTQTSYLTRFFHISFVDGW